MKSVKSCVQVYRDAVARLLSANISNATHEAAWILEDIVGLTRLMIHTSPDRVVSDDDCHRICECVERRATGEPLQHILGSQEFWGLDFMVSRNVLIPRPETELLVQAGLSRLEHQTAPIIIDVGTGSGCLAIALSLEIPDAMVFAVDRCPMAIQMARRNAHTHHKLEQVKFCVGDLMAPLFSPRLVGKVTAIVANLPYIREDEIRTLSREVRDFEPTMALNGGPDGLDLYRRLLPEAEIMLAPHGYVIMEVGEEQASQLCEEVCAGGNFRVDDIMQDSLGIQRVVCIERNALGV